MKRSSPDYSTSVVEEKTVETVDYGSQSQPVLKLKRSRQAIDASKRLAFELSQFSTQQEILQTLVDLEKELPLESLEVADFVIRTLWERFYETEDVVVRVKVISLLESVGTFPGVNVHAMVEDLISLLNTKGEARNTGTQAVVVFFVFFCLTMTSLNQSVPNLRVFYLSRQIGRFFCKFVPKNPAKFTFFRDLLESLHSMA